MEGDLDRQDIIRDIFNRRLSFMSEEFYRAEVKRQRKDSKFRMSFDDLLQAISDKVRTMKAQGFSSKKDEPAKIQALDGNEKDDAWKRKAESPPKPQPPKKQKTISCFICNASHPLEKCNKLLSMPLEQRTEILRKDRRCFRCLEKEGHIAKWCQSEGFKCADCGFNHPTILCGLRKLMQEKKKEQIAAQNQNGNQRQTKSTSNGGNGRTSNANGGASTSNGNPSSSSASTSSGASTSNGASAPGGASTSSSDRPTHNVNSI